MKYRNSTLRHLISALLIWSLGVFGNPGFADENVDGEVISPLRLDRDLISGNGLEEVPWFDNSVEAKWNFLFTGKELSVSVFESILTKDNAHKGSSKSRVKDFPFDEFVLVLSGKSVLTDASGKSQTFVAGDFFIVPKGFSGTWESFGVYRELIVILEEAVRTRKIIAEPIDQ